ncbi:hypothetical protein [Arthrobacter sp. BF1]|uniref:hypothetical protein n=1 Tax=Arthrobacter sp. BF1 TaxID=2821145 RepID=UPI001C4F4C0A|nr:hypothetical protein [Arthrobacter sp. BF1]
MTLMFEPLAAGTVAASNSSSFSTPPYFVLIIIGVVLLSSLIKAASRKKREQRANPYVATKPSGRTGVAHQPTNAPYVGTLLNGVPLNNYDTSHGHQTTGFANERMRAEAELKRQLDELDTARRNGQVTAEQYAVHRETIFKNF